MKKFSLFFLIAVTGLLFLIPAKAIDGTGISALPANPKAGEPRTAQIYIYTLEPGTVLEDEVKISNNENVANTVSLYASDSLLNNDGQLSCKQWVEAKTQDGKWIKVSSEDNLIPAHTTQKVKFTISVPEHAAVGEHNACIVVQKKVPPTKDTGSGLNLSIRLALRVLITIPGEIKKEVSIKDFKYQDTKLFTELKNEGNISVEGDLSVDFKLFALFDWGSLHEKANLSRNSTLKKELQIKDTFWGGVYRADLGFEYINGNDELVKLHKSDWYIIWPAWWLILVVLVPGTLSYAYHRYKRYEHKKQLNKNSK